MLIGQKKALIKSERENRLKIRMAKLNKRLARKRAMVLKKRNKTAKKGLQGRKP